MDFLDLPLQYFIKQALPKNQSLEEREEGRRKGTGMFREL